MLNRRHFTTGLASAALAATSGRSRAAGITMRWGNASGFPSPQLAYGTVGMHAKLGFYAQEGIDLEVLNLQGSALTMQSVLQGSCEFATISPISFLPLVAANPSLDLVVPYVWLRQLHTGVHVLPDSPYQKVADLRGKNIGCWNTSDTSYSMARQMVKELGFQADRDFDWTTVGLGLPAGKALHDNKVDALAYADTEVARLELAGFPMRQLPNVGTVTRLFGLGWGVRRSALKQQRKAYVGLMRGMAKSTIFTYANPELATRLHFELFPEAKPKGIDLEKAIKESQHSLNARKDKWFPAAGDTSDPRIGGQTQANWEEWLRFTQLDQKIKDASILFTNEILDEANDFDQEAIRKMAQQG